MAFFIWKVWQISQAKLATGFDCALRFKLGRIYRAAGNIDVARYEVVQPFAGIVDNEQMNALVFQPVVVVKAFGVNDGDIAFAILG